MRSGLNNIITITIILIIFFKATVNGVHTDVDVFTESGFMLV
jgi:hypothetical protein